MFYPSTHAQDVLPSPDEEIARISARATAAYQAREIVAVQAYMPVTTRHLATTESIAAAYAAIGYRDHEDAAIYITDDFYQNEGEE